MRVCTKIRKLNLSFCAFSILFPVAIAAWAQENEGGASDQQNADTVFQSSNAAEQTGIKSDPDLIPGGEVGPNYLLGPGDVLTIDVFQVPELSKVTVRVENDGTIALPLLGHVKASGLTTEEFRQELQSQWGQRYLQDPQVTLLVKEFHAQPVSVIGAVEKPGLYPLTTRRTLIEVLSMAGGLSRKNVAPGRTVYVTRKAGFGALQPMKGMRLIDSNKVEIDLRELLYSRQASLNIDIKPLDIVSVSRAPIVYVTGDVRKPGGFVLDDRETVTVLQAVALAEGLNGTAAKSRARIIRRSEDGSRTEIKVDLEKVLKGKSQDVELAANDILFVPTSAGKSGGRRAADIAIATISGLLIYGRL
jgi:polysaccharide export outer membrane protein